MTLRDMIETDAALFVSTSDFGESVVYRKRNNTTRTINAVVIRQVAELISDEENRALTVFEVHVINDSTTGITTTEIDLGGDSIEIADRVGKLARPRSIIQIQDQDEGMIVLQCQ
jgi:hypothetical protein